MTVDRGFTAIRRATCAIGWTTTAPPTDPSKFEILGTGFVFGPERELLTCLHVIDELNFTKKKRGTKPTYATLQFVLPVATQGRPGLATIFLAARPILRIPEADIAVLQIIDLPADILPAPIAASDYIPEVGEEMGVCGYAHGSSLLRKGAEITRFGPILQRGIVSALAPYEAGNPAIMLLDVIAGQFASGSPVFRVTTGEVCGVLFEGQVRQSAALSAARLIHFSVHKGLGARVSTARRAPMR
jgi:hypothetical protein